MTQLHFNVKDVFRAVRLGFSIKKIWVHAVGFAIGALGYAILTYVAQVLAGWYLDEIWLTHRILFLPTTLPWYGWVIWAVGVVWFVIMILLTGTAISKITYEQLKGDEFYEVKEAWKFALDKGKSTFSSPGLVILFIIFLVIMGLILSLIGRIPYFGDLFVGIMAIPAFTVALFIIYLLIVFLFTLIIGPAVVGTTKSDTFDTLFEVFSLVNDQPHRLIWYGFILAIVAKFVSFILALASLGAVQIGVNVIRIFMGGKVETLFHNGLYYVSINLPHWIPAICRGGLERISNVLGMGSTLEPSYYIHSNWAQDIGSFFLGITLYIVILFVISYAGTTWFAGQTVIYTALVKKKDDRNLLEVKEEEKMEEEKLEEKPKKKEEKPPERKRGRPRKKKTPPKRKRGRPRKTK